MFDLNKIVTDALQQAVAEAIKPLIERITALESDAFAMRDNITALETKLTEAALFERNINVQTLITPETVVNSMNNAEWLWEKVNAYIETGIDDRIERAIDDHCSTYDHDDYDNVVSNWNDEDPTEFVRESDIDDKIEGQVNEVLRNATVSISI